MRDRQPIREARETGTPIRAIARDLGIDRNTVRRAIAPGARDTYWRASPTEEVAEAVRDVLADYPNITVPDIAALIDWRRSRRALSNLVSRLRPQYLTGSGIEARAAGTLRSGAIRCSARPRAGAMTAGTMIVGRPS